ncbi:MAG TPA: ABC transporter permease [Candidatus Sulfopaludibacter sp.]|jgi:putative ABC transport system permease protein|nr:ABC transporter permease [Candidatus Sulfopaludibacter sp.]
MAFIWNDIRLSIRLLRRGRGFAAASLTAIALATGANTAVFSLVYSVVLRPLPYPEPGRLMSVTQFYPSFKETVVTAPIFFDWQAQQDAALAAYSIDSYTLTGSGLAESVPVARVSHEFFSVLGIAPDMGRSFTAAEDRLGAAGVVVVSRAFWNGRPRRDSIQLDGRPYRVVGELPPSFDFPPAARVWVPIGLDPASGQSGGPVELVRVIGRLRPGATDRQLTAALAAISARAQGFGAGGSPVVAPLRTWLTGKTRQVWLVLMGVVIFVLLIASANVAGLLVARSAARRGEMAVRVALGASAARLRQQRFIECLVLAVAGSAAGVALAAALLRAILPLIPATLLAGRAIHLDGPVFLFTTATAVAIAVLFGLAPAAKIELRGALVVAEVALSLALLTGATLMARSFAAVTAVDPGFRAAHLLTLSIALPTAGYREPARQLQFFDRTLTAFAALPGVRSAALTSALPFAGTGGGFAVVSVEGAPPWDPSDALRHRVEAAFVSENYFEAIGTTLLEGRPFTAVDTDSVIVNRAFARRFLNGDTATGRRIKLGPLESPAPWLTIVGTAHDSRRTSLEDDVPPVVYRPYPQRRDLRSAAILLRTAGDPSALSQTARRCLANLDSSVAASDIRTMEQRLESSVASQKLRSVTSALLALLALALVLTGLYGVLSYLVVQRAPEFGVRMAVGAGPRHIFGLVLRRGLTLCLAGIAAGVPLSLAASGFLRGLLFSVAPADPWTLAAASALMLVVALAASAVPAFRAIRTDPIRCLRQE